MRGVRFYALALWSLGVVPSQKVHLLLSGDDADLVSENEQAHWLYGVSTMDLSEARGLVLFRVIREGIGISQRLSATGTCAPTGDKDAHPRTRASQEPTGHHQKKITGDGGLFP